jgi:hypothetical protein
MSVGLTEADVENIAIDLFEELLVFINGLRAHRTRALHKAKSSLRL